MKFKNYISLILIFQIAFCFGQEASPKLHNIDSLKQLLHEDKQDLEYNTILAEIGWNYLDLDNKKSVEYALQAYHYADTTNKLSLKERSSYIIAQAYNAIGDYPKAMEFFSISNELCRAEDDTVKVINIENGMGNLYLANEEYRQAMIHFHEANVMAKMINDEKMTGITNVSLGYAYTSLELHDSAMIYYKKALDLFDRKRDEFLIGATYTNMATSLMKMQKLNDAIVLAKKGLRIMLNVDNKYGIASAYEVIGEIYYEKGEYERAFQEYNNAERMFKEINSLDNLQRVYNDLALLYAKVGDKDKAYDYLVRHIHLKDSIFNRSKERIIAEMESKYENELKNHQIEILNKEKKAQDIELDFRRQEELYIVSALVIIILFLVYVTYFFYKNKKLNKELSRTIDKVRKQSDKIEKQHSQITHAHDEILGSIKYAKRIQSAILPHDDLINSIFKESFVLYMPKDVVSGDFYWMHKVSNEEVLFAAVDCTGHGVPGGFMSIVGYHGLETNVNEFKLIKPSNILDGMNHIVNDVLQRGFGSVDVKDGMDAALCLLNVKTGLLQFAGAYNPVWILRNKEIIEIKGTKQAIGAFMGESKLFENHEIQLEDGDKVYVFSDGYMDQFGGPKGKKIMSKGMKNILIKLADKSMKKQRVELQKYIYNWMNESEEDQGDDICVLGIQWDANQK